MDAIDTTYQNLPNMEVASQIIEKENETFDDAVEKSDSAFAVEDRASFEDVMSSIFEVDLEVSQEIETEEQSVAFLSTGTVDEDVNLLMDSSNVRFLDRKASVEELEITERTPIFAFEEIAVEEIPFVEFELNIGEQSSELKGIKKANDKNDKKVSAKLEEKENVELMGDNSDIKNAIPIQHKKIETHKKDENKKENKIEEKAEVEVLDAKIPQKQKTMKLKKLPIVVEDLRTAEETKMNDASSTSFGSDVSSEEFASHYEASEANVLHSSEVSSLSEEQGIQNKGQFASVLAEQIKANATELVERGRIVLQDGNVGEIRLQLKPAHLGNVKIQLKMSGDKKMQGEVTVFSKEAFDAFEESMQDLVASFNDAGFEASGFNLNWKNGEKEEVVRDDLSNQYFSPEKTHLSLSERLNLADNVYGFDKAKQLNVLV